MKWFKSTETNVSASRNKYATNIISSPDQYQLSRYNSSTWSRNSTCGTLYRDIFSLLIKNFTTDNNGYYWCQVVVNGSFLQPSQHAWFYADHSDSCERQHLFRLAEKAQCANILYQANNVNPTQSMFISSSSYSSSSTVILYTTASQNITQLLDYTNSSVHLYIIGSLVGLVLVLGVVVIALLVLYIHKCHEKKRREFSS